MLLQGGTSLGEVPIGVISLESYFAKPVGHIRNPATFRFPLVYEVVSGVSVARLLFDEDDELVEPVMAAARRLETQGVKAIAGSCGFLALYQERLASAVSVPVFGSSLIQLPMIAAMLGSRRKVGVLTASRNALTCRHLDAVGASGIPVAVRGMEGTEEFWPVIVENRRNALDTEKAGDELVAAARALVGDEPEVGALLLECTDMPPFAHRIQQAVGLPVFDLTTLTEMVFECVVRRAYRSLADR